MVYLLITVCIWSFAFGLVKNNLTAFDPYAISCLRLGLAFLTFLPWITKRGLKFYHIIALMGMGAIQYGLMYCLYMEAAQYLQAYEIALFTFFVPLYIIAFQDLYSGKIALFNWGMALLAYGGAMVIRYTTPLDGNLLKGFFLMQGANLCFAWGTIAYRSWRQTRPSVKDHQIFAWLFMGAAIFTGLAATFKGDWTSLMNMNLSTGLTLFYLGIVSTGVAFFTWNKGAVSTHPASVAVISQLKVPLGVLASLLFFGEKSDWVRLSLGLSIMLFALYLTERHNRKSLRSI